MVGAGGGGHDSMVSGNWAIAAACVPARRTPDAHRGTRHRLSCTSTQRTCIVSSTVLAQLTRLLQGSSNASDNQWEARAALSTRQQKCARTTYPHPQKNRITHTHMQDQNEIRKCNLSCIQLVMDKRTLVHMMAVV